MASPPRSPSGSPPSLDNLYLVSFGDMQSLIKTDYKNGPWVHLLRSQIVMPFIPCDNDNRVRSFEKDTIAMRYNYPFLNSDPMRNVLATITTRELLNFSEASKSFYLAVRSNAIWETKLKRLLPSTHYLTECAFNPEQQFQIVFYRISKMKKPYDLQLQQYENAAWDLENKIEGLKSQKPIVTDNELRKGLIELRGQDFDGTQESIAPSSKMGRCLNACHLIAIEFNNQDRFEGTIRASEKIYRWEHVVL